MNRYSKEISSFKESIELGINIPIPDFKLLDSYSLLTVNGSHSTSASSILINETMGDEIISSFIKDLNGKNIKNLSVGPSTASGSKNIEQMRPAKQSGISTLNISQDIDGNADLLRMSLNDEDNLFAAKIPDNWDINGTNITSIRTPKMLNVKGHVNSIITNLTVGNSMLIGTPMTAQGSISEDWTYRFSFYFRMNGSATINIYVNYYTDSGAFISQHFYNIGDFVKTDDEDSDWSFNQIGMPLSNNKIPAGYVNHVNPGIL